MPGPCTHVIKKQTHVTDYCKQHLCMTLMG